MAASPNSGVDKSVTVTPARDPEEDISIVLQDGNVESSHLVVWHRAVWEFHVYVPRRVGHDNGKLPQYRHVQLSEVALHPLWQISNNKLT